MKSSVFQTLLSGLSNLTSRQRTLLQEHLHKAEQAEITQRLIEPEDDHPPPLVPNAVIRRVLAGGWLLIYNAIVARIAMRHLMR